MNALTIASMRIRQDEAGRYCLNDVHRAAGGKPKHRPSIWLKNRQAQELANELELEAGIPALTTVRGGARAGTYAAEPLVVAFAAWVSPRFHANVLGVFLQATKAQYAAARLQQLEDPSELRGLLLAHSEQEIALRSQLEQQREQLAAFERLAGARGGVSITAAAKLLDVPPMAFFAWLGQNSWIYRSSAHGGWLAFQAHMDRGHLRHRITTVERSDGTPKVIEQVIVMPKGLSRLAELLERASRLEQSPAGDSASPTTMPARKPRRRATPRDDTASSK